MSGQAKRPMAEPLRRLGGLGSPGKTEAPKKKVSPPRLKTGSSPIQSDLVALKPPEPAHFGPNYAGYLKAHASYVRYRTSLMDALATRELGKVKRPKRPKKDIGKTGQIVVLKFQGSPDARVKLGKDRKIESLRKAYLPSGRKLITGYPEMTEDQKRAKRKAKAKRHRLNKKKAKTNEITVDINLLRQKSRLGSLATRGDFTGISPKIAVNTRQGGARPASFRDVPWPRGKKTGVEKLVPSTKVSQADWEKLTAQHGREAQKARRRVRRGGVLVTPADVKK